MDSISEYREIRVLIYPGEGVARVGVLCRVVHRGRARDVALLPRGGVEVPIGDTDTVDGVLRAAASGLTDIADSMQP